MELTNEQIAQLDALTITKGTHADRSGTCWMEAIALITGETWTDFPSCVPHEVAKLGQQINDGPWPDDATRTRELRARTPYLLRVETRIDATRKRACIAAQIGREVATDRLRAAGRDVSAIEALVPITDRESALAVQDALRTAATAHADAAYAAYAAAAAAATAVATATAAAAYAADAAYASTAAAYAADAAADAARQAARLRIMDAWIGYPGDAA